MPDKLLLPSIGKYFKSRFLFVLIALMSLMMLSPMLAGFVRLNILIDVFITIVFISCISAVSNTRRQVFICVVLALPTLLGTWLPDSEKHTSLYLVGNVSGILFMAFVIVSMPSFIFKEREVKANLIYASIVTYLLLAFMWTFIFKIIETVQPGSFFVPGHILDKEGNIFTYYSFVTITTLGYGEITPVKDVSRAFAALEAVIGQIYLVVLVARLVGLNIAQTMNKKP